MKKEKNVGLSSQYHDMLVGRLRLNRPKLRSEIMYRKMIGTRVVSFGMAVLVSMFVLTACGTTSKDIDETENRIVRIERPGGIIKSTKEIVYKQSADTLVVNYYVYKEYSNAGKILYDKVDYLDAGVYQTEYEYDEDGECAIRNSYDADMELRNQAKYERDTAGRLTEIVYAGYADRYSRYSYEYENGCMTRNVVYSHEGESLIDHRYYYDDGRIKLRDTYNIGEMYCRQYYDKNTSECTAVVYYDEDMRVSGVSTIAYDTINRVKEIVNYEMVEALDTAKLDIDRIARRNVKTKNVKLYAEYDLLKSEVQYSRDGMSFKLDYEEERDYDKYGNIVSEIRTEGDGEVSEYCTYEYRYDSLGNWVEKVKVFDGKVRGYEMIEREVEYYL